MTFQIRTAITGKLAKDAAGCVPSSKPIPFKRSQDIPLPYMWQDTKDGGTWKPTGSGASILDPNFDWGKLATWAWNYGDSSPDDALILDIEAIWPFLLDTKLDSVANYTQLTLDLLKTRPGFSGSVDAVIAEALRNVFERLLDDLARWGIEPGLYGIPNNRHPLIVLGTPEFERDYAWLFRRLRYTCPVLYPPNERTELAQHVATVIVPRIRTALRLCPMAKCLPFVSPYAAGGGAADLPTDLVRLQIIAAKNAGAHGVIVWNHIDTKSQLERWTLACLNLLNPAIEEVIEG